MDSKPAKFWAYVAILAGSFLTLSGIAALIGYLDLPVDFLFDDVLSYEIGQIAAVYLGLICGPLAAYHGFRSVNGRASNPLKMPTFYIYWILLALILGLGILVLNTDLAVELLFPPIFMLGAALSPFAVLAWAYRKMGWPITWRQGALAFVSGSTLSIIVTIFLGTILPYLAYLLIEPAWYIADDFADLAWGAPGFVERLFSSPLIVVVLAVTAVEAPIPEEFAKALGIPLFGRKRVQNARQAFAIGLASGAGFAVLENMLYEGLYAGFYGWGWGGITLLRSIGSVLHPLGTAIIALGWFRMKEGGGGKLLKAYLLAVGLHTLWNGGFEPLLYLTGLEYFAGEGPSLSFYGETLSALLVGYLVLLSIGLWWLLRRIVNQLSERVTIDLTPATVSRRAVAVWALACVGLIIPIGASVSPAWSAIRSLVLEGRIRAVETPKIGTAEEALEAINNEYIPFLYHLSSEYHDLSKITQPGDVYAYTISMDESFPALMATGWCTSSEEILEENFEHIEYEFSVGDEVIDKNHIAYEDPPPDGDGTACRTNFVVITEWPRGRHNLEIKVTFTQSITDGWDTYPAGTHYFRYQVTVKR